MNYITTDLLIEWGVSESEVEDLANSISAALSLPNASQRWIKLSKEVLKQDHPFELHREAFQLAYRDWDQNHNGPPPCWFPDNSAASTNISNHIKKQGLKNYSELYFWSVRERPKFWDSIIKELGIVFKKPYSQVVDLSRGAEFPKWLVDSKINISDSCFLANVDSNAIIYQKEGGALQSITYGALKRLASQVAYSLSREGFRANDCIAIDMSMTVESVAIYLGIVMLGCAVVSIADSFAPEEIQARLKITNTKAIFTQDYIERGGKRINMYEKVVKANAPCVIVIPWGENPDVTLRSGDLDWRKFLSNVDDFQSVPCNPDESTNLLFSSGTTGDPKVIPWSHTTPIKAAMDGYFHHDIQQGDVIAWPTNLGWMMGPWLIYSTLVNKATMALYYGAPQGRDFGKFVESARVSVLGLVPSLVKIWRSSQCMKGLDWGRLKAFSSTGECSNADDYLFLSSLANYKPVIEYCGGTEIGGGYLTGTLVEPSSPAVFSTPALGLELEIMDEDGKPSDKGEVFLKPPSIGLSLTLLNRDHHAEYFEKVPKAYDGSLLRRHGDEIERLPNGYFRALGRADDTMNLGGIKVSSTEIERTLNQISGIVETAAIAYNPKGGGPSHLVVYVVTDRIIDKGQLKTTMQDQIKRKLNPLFKIEDVIVVEKMPRTASNKVMRRMLRTQYFATQQKS